MTKAATVRARLEPGLKNDAEHILHDLGMTATQAISVFYKQILLRRGLPFEVAIPNSKTSATFKATDKGRGVVKAKDSEDMFKRLGV
jgi:DNA-damage-inducible protein J